MGATTSSKARQREATRQALITTARALFSRRGYAEVGLNEIARELALTKGALYHHFGSKAGLFRAVVRQAQEEVADRVVAAAERQGDPWEGLLAGCREFLVASSAPEVRRVMLVDGPAVLGWEEWRALDEESSARHLDEVLDQLMTARVIDQQPREPLVRLLSGAMNEAALWLARADSPAQLEETVAALRRLLGSLRSSPGGSPTRQPPVGRTGSAEQRA
ncbi:TetR/AcrR family transcriptional regulator [Actinoalloteichus sp. AHMU CJ021]|uniref:Transcriptional regulator, TetR family n=1 Tax=Actinoalloteichus caeruleus DSM 43889 TaxID=1120930 RepID=A0ABT1JNK8_ACTCY|nr:TetR/AcrR family transcriptional regulator [Actinoalloteichus caeruleus]AUS79930.1 TetR/AcrR family transcriptional regulator [Actinoalloteichus sp. AHMU CJ021]MCP2334110.1 transcriptional regulator, TetR family [Actinoalloteichus caeruleus DSM 43889]